MANYTVRVELRDDPEPDYERLHEEMEKRGFSRSIKSGNGTTYRLPPAEYNLPGSTLDRDRVLAKAKVAASAVSDDYAVLVTESAGRVWSSLKKAG